MKTKRFFALLVVGSIPWAAWADDARPERSSLSGPFQGVHLDLAGGSQGHDLRVGVGAGAQHVVRSQGPVSPVGRLEASIDYLAMEGTSGDTEQGMSLSGSADLGLFLSLADCGPYVGGAATGELNGIFTRASESTFSGLAVGEIGLYCTIGNSAAFTLTAQAGSRASAGPGGDLGTEVAGGELRIRTEEVNLVQALRVSFDGGMEARFSAGYRPVPNLELAGELVMVSGDSTAHRLAAQDSDDGFEFELGGRASIGF